MVVQNYHRKFLSRTMTGLNFRKKKKQPWGQLVPKFLDLVASTNVLVAKNCWPNGNGPNIFTRILLNFRSKNNVSSIKMIQITPRLFGDILFIFRPQYLRSA